MEVKELPLNQRPRERLTIFGPRYLTDRELMSVIIGSGIKGKGVFQLAEEVIDVLEKNRYKFDCDILKQINGLGNARASLIAAALEFSRRVLCPGHQKIIFPRDAMPIIRHYADRRQEHFLCLSLNGAHEVIALRIVSIGLLNRTMVHPREVFADPITDRAASIVCAHNHPSGNVAPSNEDRDVTFMLKKAGDLLGIMLLDHIIFTDSEYFSFKEQGEI